MSSLAEQDRTWLVTILRTFRFIQGALEQKNVAVAKLRQLLFGKKTEKDKTPRMDSGMAATQANSTLDKGDQAPPAMGVAAVTQEPSVSVEAQILDQLDPPPEEAEIKPSPPGHGRRPADTWEDAKHIYHCHECYQAGQTCPQCKTGKLYPYDKPSIFARIVGQAPLAVEVHHGERLRCNVCGELFTAPLPKEVNDFPAASPAANAVAAVTKYQAATPFHRFAAVLKNYGLPLPKARLYEMAASVAYDAEPVFNALRLFAAQGELFHNDDTRVLIQSLLQENQAAEKAGIPLKRTGMFTTGIISQVGEIRIFLYFIGRNHAGENLASILAHRLPGLSPPTHVSDRSPSCQADGFLVDDGACLDHARREFKSLNALYPASCGYVVEQLKTVYRADKIAKKKQMTGADRLALHQQVSLPVMARIKLWGETQLNQKMIEPNSPLGGAIRYFLNHYPALTLFTRKIDVPLSNADCEQSLKTPIAVRKMSYFYKTEMGAQVAAILFSLIQTCTYSEKNVFEYFVALQKNAAAVRNHPELWFPWNFRLQLKSSPK